MPGLADMHMHTRDSWDDLTSDWPLSPLLLYFDDTGFDSQDNFGIYITNHISSVYLFETYRMGVQWQMKVLNVNSPLS